MEIRTREEKDFCIREMLIDGQAACKIKVINYTMRIGAAQVRMAGIADVETYKEHRMKGYMRILFQDTLDYMQHEGFDVSALFGIPNFYPKFGYATCMALPRVTVKTRDAELANAQALPLQVRPLMPADLSVVTELYNRANSVRTCSVVRVEDPSKGFTQGTGWWMRTEAVIFERGEHCFAGYAAWDKNDQAVDVTEVEAVDEILYPALLDHFAQQAIAKRCETIRFNMPPDHPFAEFVQRYGCEWTITQPRQADGMLRIMNQATLFDKLRPELERRLSAVRMDHLPGTIFVRTELGETTICASAPERAALELPQDKLMQLIAGYRSAHDCCTEQGIKMTPGSEPLWNALFPKGHPYMWVADHF
ncbi:MAG TPA: GNAT family N-acetyltransferase [Anaerolineae bacterium]